jgi:GNAT superfamily N-acetyltransferase
MRAELKPNFPRRAPSPRYGVQAPVAIGNTVVLKGMAQGSPQPAGTVQLRVDPAARTGSIMNLQVAPAHRRQGVATMLVHSAVAQAKLRGVAVLSLDARPSEPGISAAVLVNFYQRFGFRQSAVTPQGSYRMEAHLRGALLRTGAVQRKAPFAPARLPLPGVVQRSVTAKKQGECFCTLTATGGYGSIDGEYDSSIGYHAELDALEKLLQAGGTCANVESIKISSGCCKACREVLRELGLLDKVDAPEGTGHRSAYKIPPRVLAAYATATRQTVLNANYYLMNLR